MYYQKLANQSIRRGPGIACSERDGNAAVGSRHSALLFFRATLVRSYTYEMAPELRPIANALAYSGFHQPEL